jgi:hypothetical protein
MMAWIARIHPSNGMFGGGTYCGSLHSQGTNWLELVDEEIAQEQAKEG